MILMHQEDWALGHRELACTDSEEWGVERSCTASVGPAAAAPIMPIVFLDKEMRLLITRGKM
jgi:hypothetical protein